MEPTANMARSGCPNKFTLRADCKMLKMSPKTRKSPSRTCNRLFTVHPASLHSQKDIRWFDRLFEEETFALCWNDTLFPYESSTEIFGHQNSGHVWIKPNTAFQEKNLILTVKHGGVFRDLSNSHHRSYHAFFLAWGFLSTRCEAKA